MIDLDHAVRVIRARCGDALTPVDLALVERALSGRDAAAAPEGDEGGKAIPGEIGEKILEVLEAMEARLAALEEDAA
jgi:hypothetical protein